MDVVMLKEKIETAIRVIQHVYRTRNNLVVGYSGGKDSTATLQLTWMALSQLPSEERTKDVSVISTDTLVEQPIVAEWVTRSIKRMNDSAKEQGIPLTAHKLVPELKDRYWVNLLGRRYAAPRSGFRWCTERLKIRSSNNFIQNSISKSGEAIMILGTRKSESAARLKVMEKFEEQRTEAFLSPNGALQNSYVLSPVEDWTQDDIWMFLMQFKNPWGHSNKELLTLYQSGTDGGECPLIHTSENGKVTTPSCGSSRFGCYVCTLVNSDKSMNAMIANDSDKSWLMPMVALRDELALIGEGNKIRDYHVRDFRRTGGGIKLYRNTGMPIPGPYTREHSHFLLKRVLETQKQIRSLAPDDMKDIEIIRMEELHEIRRLWKKKHEWEDAVPRIYEEVMGEPFPCNDYRPERMEEWELLKNACGDNPLDFEAAFSLLDVAERDTMLGRKKPVLEEMEDIIRRCYYDGPEDAAEFHRKRTGWKPPEDATTDEESVLPEGVTLEQMTLF